MSDWKLEVLRSAVQCCYWRDYRNANGVKRSNLHFMYDVMGDALICESPFADDSQDSDEWLRRFHTGYREKETGRYIYTIPQQDRLDALDTHTAQSGFLMPVALEGHKGEHNEAAAYAKRNGYHTYADQTLLSGALRGDFLGICESDNIISNTILAFHLLDGERFFRLREVSVEFIRRQHETAIEHLSRSATVCWDRFVIRDGWAVTGTDYGSIFLLSDRRPSSADTSIGDYHWNNKASRILSLTLRSGKSDITETDFRLCQRPVDINRSLDILRSIPREIGPAQAAE